MPTPLSMTTVLAIFYAVLASQIFLVSIYYPEKLCRRIEYVVKNYPRSRYPKLYPGTTSGFGGVHGERRLRLFRGLNQAIALLGGVILGTMAVLGYRPDLKGGDEIFVMLYFFLQVAPLIYVELKEYEHLRLLRKGYSEATRSANLNPRRLFDFVSPAQVAAAVVLYVAFVAYYLWDKGWGQPWEAEVYFTLAGMTMLNLAFAVTIARLLVGKRPNPYQAHADRLRQIESVTKVMLFSSIGASFFLIMTITADRYAWEVLDPPLVSLYLQLCVVFGVGLMFRSLEVETLDFEVYRDEATEVSG